MPPLAAPTKFTITITPSPSFPLAQNTGTNTAHFSLCFYKTPPQLAAVSSAVVSRLLLFSLSTPPPAPPPPPASELEFVCSNSTCSGTVLTEESWLQVVAEYVSASKNKKKKGAMTATLELVVSSVGLISEDASINDDTNLDSFRNIDASNDSLSAPLLGKVNRELLDLSSRLSKDVAKAQAHNFSHFLTAVQSLSTSNVKVSSMLQFRVLTHLAAERLFLVWQRFSIVLIKGAVTLLQIAMVHERNLNNICNDVIDDDSVEQDDDRNLGVGDGDRRTNDNTDDCKDPGTVYELTAAFWVTFLCGCVFMLCTVFLGYAGPEQFSRTKKWLHGYGGAKLVMFGESDVNLLIAGVVLVTATVLMVFITEGYYELRDPKF